MPRKLYVKLTATLLVLLLLVGVINLISALVATDVLLQEASQMLNLELAANLARGKHETLIDESGELRSEGLDELFHWFMVVNPNVEFYLLDPRGFILAYDPTPGPAKLQTVDLEPIQSFLGREEHWPIVGDDPRDPRSKKIFSVAPIPPEGAIQGYLYIVLKSRQATSAFEALRASFIFRLAAVMLGAYLVLTAAVGGFLFARLTRPLRELARRMGLFRFPASHGNQLEQRQPAPSTGDEVQVLHDTFDEMEERIREQVEEMKRLEDARLELIANVSHDLRTPMASLQGYLETLALKEGSLSEEDRSRYLDIALRQSNGLTQLINELFELTKLESPQAVAQLEELSIADLVQDNIQRSRARAAERGVHLAAEIDPPVPLVTGDLRMLERALQNLIENSIRFTAPGGSVSVRLQVDRGKVTLCVADTGCGISPDDLPHIFDRFYRSGRKGDRWDSGAGLGLAITKRILDLHDSEIEVESEEGRGSTFSFSLPTSSS